MSTAVERYEAPSVPSSPEQWGQLEDLAKRLSKSKLIPNRFQGKPEDTMVAGVSLNALGLDLTPNTLKHVWVADSQVNFSAQMQIAMCSRYGHELWFDDEQSDDKHAIAHLQKRGSQRVHTLEFTIEMAKTLGLLDEWYEEWYDSGQGKRKRKWVIKEGETPPQWVTRENSKAERKRNDAWFKSPDAMLLCRAATRLIGKVAPEVLLGIPGLDIFEPVERPPIHVDADTGEVVGPRPAPMVADPDDEIADAEIVDGDPETSGGGDHVVTPPTAQAPTSAAPAGDSPEMADDWDREALRNAIATLPPHLKDVLARNWAEAGWGSIKENAPESRRITKADGGEAWAKVRLLERSAKAEWTERRKHANAAMNEVGVKKDPDRHAFVKEATEGATESTGELTEEQLQQVLALVETRKAEADVEAQQAAVVEPEPAPAPEYSGDDPERPFD
jgi:hypothetical protein